MLMSLTLFMKSGIYVFATSISPSFKILFNFSLASFSHFMKYGYNLAYASFSYPSLSFVLCTLTSGSLPRPARPLPAPSSELGCSLSSRLERLCMILLLYLSCLLSALYDSASCPSCSSEPLSPPSPSFSALFLACRTVLSTCSSRPPSPFPLLTFSQYCLYFPLNISGVSSGSISFSRLGCLSGTRVRLRDRSVR